MNRCSTIQAILNIYQNISFYTMFACHFFMLRRLSIQGAWCHSPALLTVIASSWARLRVEYCTGSTLWTPKGPKLLLEIPPFIVSVHV
jgi:hypothetical protein